MGHTGRRCAHTYTHAGIIDAFYLLLLPLLLLLPPWSLLG